MRNAALWVYGKGSATRIAPINRLQRSAEDHPRHGPIIVARRIDLNRPATRSRDHVCSANAGSPAGWSIGHVDLQDRLLGASF